MTVVGGALLGSPVCDDGIGTGLEIGRPEVIVMIVGIDRREVGLEKERGPDWVVGDEGLGTD